MIENILLAAEFICIFMVLPMILVMAVQNYRETKATIVRVREMTEYFEKCANEMERERAHDR
jgi:cell division protein FtsX